MDVNHRLIIRHPRDGGILAERDAGSYTLPTIVADDRHTAEVDYINAAVLAKFGLTTTVLRGLSHSAADAAPIVRVHDLQAHGDVDARADHTHWVMPTAAFAPPDRATLRLWRTNDAIVD